jgi:multiple sugar transport system permease protein
MASRELASYRTPLGRLVGAVTVLFLAFYLAWTVLPIFIMFMSSFKDLLEAFQLPAVGDWAGVAVFFQFNPTFRHYENLFVDLDFSTYLANSLMASLGSALVSVVLGSTSRARRTCSSGSSRPAWRRSSPSWCRSTRSSGPST